MLTSFAFIFLLKTEREKKRWGSWWRLLRQVVWDSHKHRNVLSWWCWLVSQVYEKWQGRHINRDRIPLSLSYFSFCSFVKLRWLLLCSQHWRLDMQLGWANLELRWWSILALWVLWCSIKASSRCAEITSCWARVITASRSSRILLGLVFDEVDLFYRRSRR